MINATGGSPLAIIFSWTGSALVSCWPEVLISSSIGILAALMKEELDVDYDITLEGHVLGIFPVAFGLVFRTGMSYNRSLSTHTYTHTPPCDNPCRLQILRGSRTLRKIRARPNTLARRPAEPRSLQVHSARTLCRRARTHLISLDQSDQPIQEVVDFKRKLSRCCTVGSLWTHCRAV